MPRNAHPVRRCSPCDSDWPNRDTYNLCPICQRNTYASTADAIPDAAAGIAAIAKYKAIRDFDAQADAEAQQRRDEWDADMRLLLERTAELPDPPAAAGLAPLPQAFNRYLKPPTNAQDVRHPRTPPADNA